MHNDVKSILNIFGATVSFNPCVAPVLYFFEFLKCIGGSNCASCAWYILSGFALTFESSLTYPFLYQVGESFLGLVIPFTPNFFHVGKPINVFRF